jgi:hypothetical protein
MSTISSFRGCRWLCAAFLLAGLAGGRPGIAEGRMAHPIRLRMDGYLGPPHAGRQEQADLTLRCGSTDLRFQVTEAMVVSGGGLASRVFDQVRPYHPNFFLRGPEEVLKPISHAAAGTSWRLVGTWRPSTRDFLVGSVEPREETKHAP